MALSPLPIMAVLLLLMAPVGLRGALSFAGARLLCIAALAGGSDAVVVASFVEPKSPLITALGLELTDLEMMGRVMARSVAADPVGRTAVPRVWAAGNLTDPMSQVVMAAAAGVRTGAMVNAEMVTEDQARRLELLG